MFWEIQLSNMPSDENPASFLLWQHLIHCTPSPALGTWNMWNNHHSQCAISGISNLKKIPNLHFCWCYKENKNQIFMLIKDDKKDLFLFFPPSESPNQWPWGQSSYPKCIVDVETITELIVLPAAITSKINEPETTKAAHWALLEMRLKRITLVMTILGYYCTSKWEYFLLHLLVQTQTMWRSQPHPQQTQEMIQDTSKSLFLSPKVYSQGCFQAKWEITARTVKCLLLCPSLVKFLCSCCNFGLQCPTSGKKYSQGLSHKLA